MKTTDKSTKTKKSIDQLVSKLSATEILDSKVLSFVKGGDGTGMEPIIIIPKPL